MQAASTASVAASGLDEFDLGSKGADDGLKAPGPGFSPLPWFWQLLRPQSRSLPFGGCRPFDPTFCSTCAPATSELLL